MMIYRNWTITVYSTYLGYLAQYTSPIGQTHHTSACFLPIDKPLRILGAIDHLLRCEDYRLRLTYSPHPWSSPPLQELRSMDLSIGFSSSRPPFVIIADHSQPHGSGGRADTTWF